MGLNPAAFDQAMELEDADARAAVLERENVRLCMECGCCSYVCPAHRPLVRTNCEAIQFLRKNKAASAAKTEGRK